MNNNTKKIISIICILGIILSLFIYLYEIYKTKDYVKTTATITSNYKKLIYPPDSQSNIEKYKFVEVKYDGHINTYRVWTFLFNKEGSTTTIYYSKEDPKLIRNKFKMTTSLLNIAFLTVFLIGINSSKFKSTPASIKQGKGKIKVHEVKNK